MFEQSNPELNKQGHLRIDALRSAIQANRIHFPEPVPVFPREFRPDIQWRLVVLYFVRGWSTRSLAERYGVTKRRVQQSLLHWADRAAENGYLQTIPADNLSNLLPVPARQPVPVPVWIPERLPQYFPVPAAAAPAYAAQTA